ncbi:MAG: hypothetical protein Fur0018_08680 [Anaerolineales bacterium]
MLVSPAGYAVIDPISKPKDHELPPLEVYPWRAIHLSRRTGGMIFQAGRDVYLPIAQPWRKTSG